MTIEWAKMIKHGQAGLEDDPPAIRYIFNSSFDVILPVLKFFRPLNTKCC
jgi:hypothetical protein